MLRLQHAHPSINFQPTSQECEIWFENKEIEKGDDIADYFLRSHQINKYDSNWNQSEYDAINNL